MARVKFKICSRNHLGDRGSKLYCILVFLILLPQIWAKNSAEFSQILGPNLWSVLSGSVVRTPLRRCIV